MTQSISTKTNAVASSAQSSKDSEKLKIDFWESANGETILLEFPDGGVGIVDAHPSVQDLRPGILELVKGKRVHFVCLTHPHADHGIDLIAVLKKHSPIDAFWHTSPSIAEFVYHCATERPNYPSPVREFVNQIADGWADFLLDLYSSIDEKLPVRELHSAVQPIDIAGVRIWILGPDEQAVRRFVGGYKARASGVSRALPDPNILSAILAVQYGNSLVILGADALKAGWNDAIRVHNSHRLPRADVLKVPHHGGADALALEHKRRNYLDLCRKDPLPYAILFAGDAKHPHKRVFEELQKKTRISCLANGLKGANGPPNGLNIQILGARQVRRSHVCQPAVKIEVASSGGLNVTRSAICDFCQAS